MADHQAAGAGDQCPNLLENPIVQTITVVRMYGTAMYTVLIWDWIITWKDEYDRMWKANWTIIKALWLFLRYYTLFVFPVPLAMWDGNFTFETCERIHRLEPGLCMPIIWAAEGILLMRLYAIWEKNKIILTLGLLGMACVIAAQLLCVFVVVVLPLPPGINTFACVATGKEGPGGGAESVGYWVAPFIFDSIVTALTMYRALAYRKRTKGGAASGILRAFLKHGLVYFTLIALTNLLNTAFFLQPNQALQPVNALMTVLATSLFAQRLVLHLRSSAAQSTTGSESRSRSLSGAAQDTHGLVTIGGSLRPNNYRLTGVPGQPPHSPTFRSVKDIGPQDSSDTLGRVEAGRQYGVLSSRPQPPPNRDVDVSFGRHVHSDGLGPPRASYPASYADANGAFPPKRSMSSMRSDRDYDAKDPSGGSFV